MSVILFLTVAQTGCTLPTFNESGLTYFKEDFSFTSARHMSSVWVNSSGFNKSCFYSSGRVIVSYTVPNGSPDRVHATNF